MATTLNVKETNSNTSYELILRGKGRLILKANGRESVVWGFGINKADMLKALNASSVSKDNRLNFEAIV